MEFNNPMFFIAVERDGKKIAEGLVPKNGALEFAGYRLEMREMPFWVRFYVIKQRGLSILYTGFAIASIGVIWRLLFYRREIVGAVREEDGERLSGRRGRVPNSTKALRKMNLPNCSSGNSWRKQDEG